MAAGIMANELERFRSDIDAFEKACKSIDDNYKNMFEEIRALDAMWEGPTHDAFVRQVVQDSESMEEIVEYLKEILEDLRYAHKEYTGCERQVSDIVNSLNMGGYV